MTRAKPFLACIFVAACAAGDSGSIEYRPSDDVERLAFVTMSGDDIGMVGDFDITEDAIYLLDRMGRVVVLNRAGEAPTIASHFGRRGAGPGEMLQPTGISVSDDGIAVVDATRLHFYSAAGEPLVTHTLDLPCVMMLPGVSVMDSGIFVTGGCLRSGYASDTMKAVMAWSADTAVWTVLAEAPRYTRDGSVGSVFGARSLFTPGPSRQHAFGGGETNCVWLVDTGATPPQVKEQCPAARTGYTAEPTPELRAQLRTARVPGMNIRWPETLPTYIERFVTDSALVLVRPFTADSVVLQVAGGETDIAVAPLDGLLGCKAQGCLWLRDEGDVPELIVLDRARIERLLSVARSR